MRCRVVADERLDALLPDDPLAIGSRRDLIRINRVMGHPKKVADLLTAGASHRILEIGAGDARFMADVARRLANHSPREVCCVLLDRQRFEEGHGDEFARYGWNVEAVASDVFDYLKEPNGVRFDVIVANLFLHHFEDDRLAELLRLVSERTDRFIACEPRRSKLGLTSSKFLGAIGCNSVTRHDAAVSVRAGFCGTDLSALWPGGGDPNGDWLTAEYASAPFSHVFTAERKV